MTELERDTYRRKILNMIAEKTDPQKAKLRENLEVAASAAEAVNQAVISLEKRIDAMEKEGINTSRVKKLLADYKRTLKKLNDDFTKANDEWESNYGKFEP